MFNLRTKVNIGAGILSYKDSIETFKPISLLTLLKSPYILTALIVPIKKGGPS